MKFSVKRGCIKCGNQGRKLVEKNDVVIFRVAADSEYIKDIDKILRTCKRCHYQWLENCVDDDR